MRLTQRLLICGMAALSLSAFAHADTVTYLQIPNALSADDMSPDGRFIVGVDDNFVPYQFDTVTNRMLLLPPESPFATATSDLGDVVFGEIADPGTGDPVAAIWTRTNPQWVSIGYLPNANACPSRSSPYELSADGSVAVGLSWDGCSGRGFRWTLAGGMVELQALANGSNRASVVSADGSVIGGFAQGSFSRTPAVWDAAGNGTLLDPPNGDALGEVQGISDDGNILLGSWDGAATMWTGPSHVRSQIAGGSILPGWTGIPLDIAGNGTIVGFDILGGNRRAWIQLEGQGPLIDLKTYVEANGGVVPQGQILEVCQAISADGLKIIGHGFGTGAWIVTITPDTTCVADIADSDSTDPDGAVDVFDLLELLANWGTNGAGAAIASPFDVVDVFDLLDLLTAWGSCQGPVGACCIDSACSQVTEQDCTTSGGTYIGNSVPCAVDTCVNNDLCVDAVDITANINGVVVLGSNSQATPPFGGGDPELPAGSPSCHWDNFPQASHSTVWYSFVGPEEGEVTISICGSEAPFNDSIMALYSGSCGNLIEIACDEDGCEDPPTAPWYSRVHASGLTSGQTYYLCVMNPGQWLGSVPGPFEFTITAP